MLSSMLSCNPVRFHLTPGQACDLDGADVLLEQIAADILLADKGYDADERVIERLQQQGKTPVIPSKRNRKQPREYDKHLYKARHLIENFFAHLKQYRAISFAGAVGNRYTLRQVGGEFPERHLSSCYGHLA